MNHLCLRKTKMKQGTTINARLKSIKLGTGNSKPDDLSSTTSNPYTSDYASYTPEDFESDSCFYVPVTPPRTPPPTPAGIDSSFKIDHAFAEAALQAKHRDMAAHVTRSFRSVNDSSYAWILKYKTGVSYLYVMVFIIGVLFGLFVI